MLALALAVGIAAQSAARHLRVPGIVLLLVAGAALGPDGLDWVRPTELGGTLFGIVDLAVAVILFEGGLNLELTRLRREQVAIRRLVTLGALVTMLGGAIAASVAFQWGFLQALLFGGLVVVTGPTVIGPLVEDLRLRPRVATVLEAEGVLIVPIGAILAVLLLELALAPGADSLASGGQELLLRLGFGATVGASAGFGLARLLRLRGAIPEGHENVFVLASVLLLATGCDSLVPHSGILAVTLAGVVVGNLRTRIDRDLREFKDQVSVLLIGLLFVLLAADVRISELRDLGLPGLAVVVALTFVIRPLGVWLSTMSSDLDLRERALIAWIAPRGIVAAAVASLTARALDDAGLAGGAELRAMVFLTIASTVVWAGLTAGPVARALGQRLPGRDVIAILGAQGLGFALAEELRRAERSVVFLDSNPANCRLAEEAGYSVVFGNALQERTMRRARFDGVGMVIGLTSNQMLNSVFASRARELFAVPEACVAAMRPDSGLAIEIVEREEVALLFGHPCDVERWDVRARHGDVTVSHWEYAGEEQPAEMAAGEPQEPARNSDAERFVVLTHCRKGQAQPMHSDIAFESGDTAVVAIYEPERREAELDLEAAGWRQLDPDPQQ